MDYKCLKITKNTQNEVCFVCFCDFFKTYFGYCNYITHSLNQIYHWHIHYGVSKCQNNHLQGLEWVIKSYLNSKSPKSRNKSPKMSHFKHILDITAILPLHRITFLIVTYTSTTPRCSGPIPAQKSRGNSVLGVVFSHTMPKMDFHYSHRFSGERTH